MRNDILGGTPKLFGIFKTIFKSFFLLIFADLVSIYLGGVMVYLKHEGWNIKCPQILECP